MPATLKDVAALARVSLTTASHALNGKTVNEQTRERVLEAAKKLKYHTSVIGRNLIKNSSNTIEILILNSRKSKDMTDEISYYYKMLQGAFSCIQKYDYLFSFQVKYWEDIENTDYIMKKVYSRSIDGMILIPQFMYYHDFVSILEEEKFPYVIINPSIGIKNESRVVIDNYKGAYLAADHLLQSGHKDIVFINGPDNHFDSHSREKGFFARLLQEGIRFDSNNVIYSDFTNDGGYQAMREVLSKGDIRPTAVFCANDYMATGAMAAIYDAGLSVPGDISVVGYDDTDVARAVYPKLTTISVDIKKVGYLAAERVFELIYNKGKEYDLNYLDEITLEPSLIERGSTRRL